MNLIKLNEYKYQNFAIYTDRKLEFGFSDYWKDKIFLDNWSVLDKKL